MAYGKEVELKNIMEMQKTPERLAAEAEGHRAFAEAMGTIEMAGSLSSEHEAESFIRMRYDGRNFGNHNTQYEQIFNKQSSLLNNRDYLRAWRGFKYNLDNCQDGLTWVAFVSSTELKSPSFAAESVTSPDIKMAMTLKLSKTFYSPLGIYNSSIAKAFDKDKEITGYRQLSIPFHTAVARFMEQINPEVKNMVIRPLESMAVIFEKSAIKFSVSKAHAQTINYPYIRCTTDFHSRIYSRPDTLTSDEKEKFGDSPYILIDSRADEYH